MHAWFENEPKLRSRIRKCAGSSEAVEDLLQDLFVKVYRNRETFPIACAD